MKRTVRRKKSNPILPFDIIGIVLIFLCPITLVALFSSEPSGLFQYAAAGMRVALGVGAYVMPFLFALLGAIFVVGPLEIIPRNIGVGSSMLFLVVMTWASLTKAIEETATAAGGGYVGDALASLLRKATGDTISYILLVLFAVIAAVIMIDVPLSSLVERIRLTWGDWREASRERAALVRDARAKARPVQAKDIVKQECPAVESRKRTLANIFSRTGEEEKAEDAEPAPAQLELTRQPVKISSSMTPRRERPPKNGGPREEPEEDAEPVEQGEFRLPPTSLLAEPPPPPPRVESELRANIEIIERTLSEFKVEANVVEIAHGPTVARYEIRLAPGIKVNKIVTLADNLAMQLSAIAVRVEAPIPGKPAIGVEVPNKERGTVVLREIVESKPFRESTAKLTFALGKDVAGRPVVADLARMPHMLIGGATNAGKSVGLNTLIASLLFRATPDELKLVLIDPKRVELTLFDGIPHLACPVVKDVKQAAGIFRSVVQEMEHRYDLFSRIGARNIDGYNEKAGEDDKMPHMVVVVDELCDLMMQAAAEVEGSITRLAQLARATGIHLVIATQRPSVDVITGIIKANIPSRVAFAVSSHHDSRTILDHKGAERLVGRGDMLFLPIDASKPVRIQGCYISEKEIDALCSFLKEQRKPMYTITPTMVGDGGSGGDGGGGAGVFADEFYEPSVRYVVSTGYCSTSMLQRKFKIGYTRAARIVDFMEEQGIVGGLDGAGTKGRQVLVSKGDLESLFGGPLGFAPDDDDDDEVPPAEIIEPDEEQRDDGF